MSVFVKILVVVEDDISWFLADVVVAAVVSMFYS